MKYTQKIFGLVLSLFTLSSTTFAGVGDFYPVRPGLRAELNQGVGSSIQFNRYSDQPHLPQIKNLLPWSITGNARYAAIRARGLTNDDDERDFVTAALDVGGDSNAVRIYKHTLGNLNKGDQIRIFTYVHNNALQGCGGINYARNTTVTLDWSYPKKVISSISASNATPRTINDILDLRFNGNYTLQHIRTEEGYKLYPDQYPIGHPLHGVCSNGSNMRWSIRTGNTQMLSASKLRVNIGNMAGSSGNARIIVSIFKIVDAPTTPSIKIDKDDSTPGTEDDDGDDKQKININGTANFTIKVTNDGEEGLKDVHIEDTLAPSCSLSVAQALTKIRIIGNHDDIFDVGENFTYTCSDTNVTEGYTNTAQVLGKSVIDNQSVSDSDPTEIIVDTTPRPSIAIDKDDSTPGTEDNDGNDTQTVNFGGKATFTIKVTNDGSVGLKKVRVEDTQEPHCVLTEAQALEKIQAIGNQDDIFDPQESFTYTCEDTNVTESYTNTASTFGTSVVDNTTIVDDSDDTQVVLNPNGPQPAIDIDKDDSTPGTEDDDGNDIQKIAPSADATATFTIKVTNTGEVDLKDIIITDPLSPGCERSSSQTEPLIEAIGNKDKIFNIDESFTYTCTLSPITESFTNMASVIGTPINGQPNVTDSDSSQVILKTKGGEGGGGGDSISAIGTCSINSQTNAAQCIARRPVEDPSDLLWVRYNECRQSRNGVTPLHTSERSLEKNCALDWAASQGLEACGAFIGGDPHNIDYFGRPTTAHAQAQCDLRIPNPPTPGSCIISGCPSCFKAGVNIHKEITSAETVARGETVVYKIIINNINYNRSDYKITKANIKVYDVMVPTESGNIWERKGIIDGDAGATWIWKDAHGDSVGNPKTIEYKKAGKYFERNFTNAEINAINNGNNTLELHYSMNTKLASKADTAQIKNVAFAVVTYEYTDYTNPFNPQTGLSKTIRIGGPKVCDKTFYRLKSVGSLGSTATVKIIRPFIQARSGNIGIQTSDNAKITSKEKMGKSGGNVLTNNSLYDSNTISASAFENISKYKNGNKNDIYIQNKQNTVKSVTFGNATFKTHDSHSNLYFLENGNFDLNAAQSDLNHLDKSATFIIENGDLIIRDNFTITDNKFFAFIVRQKNILIGSNVENIQGVFITEEGEVKSVDASNLSNAKISDRPLNISGSLIGNLRHLLVYRKFIGSNPDINLEPSISVEFDVRLLDKTPPILERFLGKGWKEEI